MYPETELYQELSFIAYYFHWSQKEVMKLDHRSRRRWCREISRINEERNPPERKEKNCDKTAEARGMKRTLRKRIVRSLLRTVRHGKMMAAQVVAKELEGPREPFPEQQ